MPPPNIFVQSGYAAGDGVGDEVSTVLSSHEPGEHTQAATVHDIVVKPATEVGAAQLAYAQTSTLGAVGHRDLFEHDNAVGQAFNL